MFAYYTNLFIAAKSITDHVMRIPERDVTYIVLSVYLFTTIHAVPRIPMNR